MSSDVKIPLTAAQIDARMLVKHMRQAPDDWQRHEALAERALLAAEQRGRKAGLEEALPLLERLRHWIEEEVGAELPFTEKEQAEFASIRSLGEKI